MEQILQFWFPQPYDYQSFWFDKSMDEYIKEKYSGMLDAMSENVSKEYFVENKTNDEKIASIILFDQFSRSIYRNDKNKKEKIEKTDTIALYIASRMIENNDDINLPIIQRMFLLMPFRHQKKSDALDYVLKKIDEYFLDVTDKREEKLLQRFKMATYSSYTPLTDRILKDDYSVYGKEYNFSQYDDVLDPIYLTYTNRQDFSNIEELPLYQTLFSFVKERDIRSIGVSLSGGVDSMVTMFLCKILQHSEKIDYVYAMHLEYSNRKESELETQLISMYCDMIGVPLYIRKVDYMQRDTVDRNFYEEETRKIRFHTYRYLSELHQISGWCLGHHHGDVAENVLMNLSSGRTIMDLAVMKTDCEMDGVVLYRPFLSHKKTDIYSIAYDFCIPYLKDTTPDWSCRGVLRRKVLPELKKQWPSIEQTLCKIGQESDEWSETVNTFILNPIKKDISCEKVSQIINIAMKDEYKKLPYSIWQALFLWMFHSIGIHMISKKNLIQFINMLDRNIEKQHRFVFSNGCIGFFMKNALRIIYIKK